VELFYYVLMLLFAILLSNFINRYIPSLSVPLIQIALGVLIDVLSAGFHLGLDPELFLVLFIAPLLFHDAMRADKKSLWSLKRPILLLAFGLVFLTVLIVGYAVHWVTPSMPLAAAFALAAALAPTDAVSVGALARKVNMPGALLGILEGESLINDASGIVSLQFAIAAMMTGAFSLAHAEERLVVVALGGALAGAVFTALKYAFVKWLRVHGMENVTQHILIGVMTPFIIYILAEALQVSGILAVVTSGAIHSFQRKRLNPENASFNLASDSVWSAVSFVLNGLVFLILGTQLPGIIITVWRDSSISNIWCFGFVLAVTLALAAIRYLWALCAIDRRRYDDSGMSRAKAGLIISLSGVRGAVTLAGALSIPFLLSDGSPFPERNLIIFTAAGVIVCSLLMANFLLPPLFKPALRPGSDEAEAEARLEIIRGVMLELNRQITPENRHAMGRVLMAYRNREQEMTLRLDAVSADDAEREEQEARLRRMILTWEKENTLRLADENRTDPQSAERYLQILDSQFDKKESQMRRFPLIRLIRRTRRMLEFSLHWLKRDQRDGLRSDQFIHMLSLRSMNSRYILEKLREMARTGQNAGDPPIQPGLIRKSIYNYEMTLSLTRDRGVNRGRPPDEAAVSARERESLYAEAAALSFQIERDYIQSMFENGRITRETAGKMRENILFLELELQKDEPA